DRLVVAEKIRSRLTDSVETALRQAEGLVIVNITDKEEDRLFSEHFACHECNISLEEIEPRLFSFNSPYGACPDCGGLGSKMYFDEDLIVPDPSLSIREGAIAPWANRNSIHFHQRLAALQEHYHFDINVPFNRLSPKVRQVLLYGSGDEEIRFYYDEQGKRYFYTKPFEGALNQMDRWYRETASNAVRAMVAQYINMRECPTCLGARLKKESLAVTVGEKNLYEVCSLPIRECLSFFETLPLTHQEALIAERILKEIKERLRFLVDVGMDYLSLERSSGTLSGGEAQRIRLATQIGSGLMGVLYVLDEPTVGLHQRDNQRLIATLKRLRDMGNTVLVVEHDEDMMNSCDHIIDMGPGAGDHGGEIVFQGTPAEILEEEHSLTGRYLSGRLSIPMPERRRALPKRFIKIEGACEHNLRDIDIKIPVGLFSAVTGVSGSGKSSMVVETLYKVMSKRLSHQKGGMGKIKRIVDLGGIERVIMINQQPIGRTPRSNPVTYTGIFSHIRDLFTELPEARMRGYKPGRFSFNVKGGRCE
ncbi:MAG: excinuclease ABC subunit UvrA, partial [Smithellaceae bacterium]|nr:excinuclease ABC subunit UvrA [Smithellaceae bacterium]